MSKSVLVLDMPNKDGFLRLEVVQYRGRRYCNFRLWVPNGIEWKPTPKGVTFPLAALPALHEAIGEYLASIVFSAN